MKRYYYISKTAAQEEHRCMVLGVHDTKLENYQEYFRKAFNSPDLEVVYYEGTYVYRVPVVSDNGEVREATSKDLYDLGYLKLEDGDAFEGEEIKHIPKPQDDNEYIWNGTEWVIDEEATKIKRENLINREIENYVQLAEKKELYEKYGFDTLEIEEQLANNILRRNELSGDNLSVNK